MSNLAIVKDGVFKSAFGRQGVSDMAREQGILVAFGSDWEDTYKNSGVVFDLLPMEPKETPMHNVPVVEDGVVRWVLAVASGE